MKYYLESMQSVFDDVKSSENGLSSQEAAKRLEQNGKNKLAEAKKDSVIKRFFDQMKDPMIVILLVAAVVSAVTDIIEAGHFTPPTDACIILVVVIINAVLGVVQESKAEKAVEALQKMSAATTKVLRDGKTEIIKSEDLVVGDVILLDAGDAIPADCRIFECASMKIEEAALTGESVPVNKIVNALMGHKEDDEVPLGDRKNMAYMGSTLVYGRGKAVVVSTGMNTEMGKIANAISLTQDGKTPLELKLEQLSKVLTKLVVGICVFIFAFDIVTKYFLADARPEFFDIALDSFITAIALAVAAIPEGLVAVMTIVLALGVTNMSKKNAIIRKMTAVETLGCTQIICSDKTGTLTKGVFEVTNIEPASGFSKDELLEYAAYAESGSSHPISLSLKKAYGKDIELSKVSDIEEISGHGVKAEYEGHKIAAGNLKLMKKEGIAVSSGNYSGTVVYVAADGKFAGVIVISVIVKPGVKEALSNLKKHGIKKTVMLTGDSASAANAVAQKIGIDEVKSELLPGDKVSQVEKLLGEKQAKENLAFVGDGINDAPVLSRADVGIAMGALGSDAAIEAADIVLMDDDPAKISLAMKISVHTLKIVRENIIFALAVKLVCLVLGALGIANMWLAIFADVGVMVIAVINATRALKIK